MSEKTFDYRRHSLKNTEGGISPEGHEAAEKLGNEYHIGPVTLAAVGVIPRTGETLESFGKGLMDNPLQDGKEIRTVLTVKKFGDMEVFKPLIEGGLGEKAKKLGGNFRALLDILSPEEAAAFCKYAFEGVEEVFEAMKDGEFATGFGHSPVLEAAAYHVDPEFVMNMGHPEALEGVTFTKHDNGDITLAISS